MRQQNIFLHGFQNISININLSQKIQDKFMSRHIKWSFSATLLKI